MFNFNQSIASRISNDLVYLSLFFVPFQIFKFPSFIYDSSQLDISTFLLMLSLVFSFFFYKEKKNLIVSLLLFAIIEILVYFYFSFQTTLRFFYFLIVYSFYLAIYFLADNYKLDNKKLFNTVIFGLLFSGVIGLFQAINHDFSIRQKSFMLEPTFSGILFFSASFGALAVFYLNERLKKYRVIFYFLFFLINGLLTRSMFIIPFFISLVLFTLYFSFKDNFKKIIIFKNAMMFLVVFCFILPNNYGYVFNILERLNLYNSYKNFSILSYLSCFDQVIHSISLSPFLGISVGSSGAFPYASFYDSLLLVQSSSNSNVSDSYSLYFRLITELGLITATILLGLLFFKLISFFKSKIDTYTYTYIFLFFYSFSAIFFCFLKGASLSHGYLFVSSFIFLYLSKSLKSNL